MKKVEYTLNPASHPSSAYDFKKSSKSTQQVQWEMYVKKETAVPVELAESREEERDKDKDI